MPTRASRPPTSSFFLYDAPSRSTLSVSSPRICCRLSLRVSLKTRLFTRFADCRVCLPPQRIGCRETRRRECFAGSTTSCSTTTKLEPKPSGLSTYVSRSALIHHVLMLKGLCFSDPKWLLALLRVPTLPLAAVGMAVRILVRLLQTQGSAYQARFANSDGGFSVLREVTARRWRSNEALVALLAMLYGFEISTVPIDTPLDSARFAAEVEIDSPYAVDIARCVVSAIASGSKAVVEKKATTQDESPRGEKAYGDDLRLLLDILDRVLAKETETRLSESPVILRDLSDCLSPLLPSPPNCSGAPLSYAAELLLDLFARVATRRIRSRDPPRTVTWMLPQFASSDASLQPLRAIYDAAASPEQEDLVVFRTLLLRRCLELLAQTCNMAKNADRLEAFVDAAVAFAFQGEQRASSLEISHLTLRRRLDGSARHLARLRAQIR